MNSSVINTKNRKKSNRKAAKENKPSFAARVTSRAKETASMGALLVNEPRSFPAASLRIFKRAFRKVWHARGGGLYACGFFVTFIWLEISMFFGEIYEAESVGSFFSGQILELLFRFSVLSLQNTVNALIWPVHIIMLAPVIGALMVGAMFLVFEYFIKEPLEEWLFGDDEESDDAGQNTHREEQEQVSGHDNR